MFWYLVSGSALGGNGITNTTDYRLYIDTDPNVSNYYVNLNWSFIK
jgi:hypothetical protein